MINNLLVFAACVIVMAAACLQVSLSRYARHLHVRWHLAAFGLGGIGFACLMGVLIVLGMDGA